MREGLSTGETVANHQHACTPPVRSGFCAAGVRGAPGAEHAVLGKQKNRADEVSVSARASMHGPHVPLQLSPMLWRDAVVPGLELEDDAVVDLEIDDARAHHVVVNRLAHTGLPSHGYARCVQLVA